MTDKEILLHVINTKGSCSEYCSKCPVHSKCLSTVTKNNYRFLRYQLALVAAYQAGYIDEDIIFDIYI